MRVKFFLLKSILFIFFWNVHSISEIKNNIIAKVGNQIITAYELENKIKTVLILSNEQINQKNIDKVKKVSLNSLINYKIKNAELSKFNIDINQLAVLNHLKNISLKLNIDQNNLQSFFENNQINYEKYVEEIKTEFLWQKLIFEIYSNKLNIDENEIISELNETIKNNNTIEQFRLAEIEAIFDTPTQKSNLIIEIEKSISENGFETTANRFSSSSTSINGGDLGWISSSGLSEELLKILSKLKLGENSKAIIQVNKIIFLKLLDKRNIKNNEKMDIEKLKLSLVNKKRNELLKLYSNNHLSKKRNSTLINLL
tara:strand:+ start:198 stop:1139 length:942 start_codon:yes stop_codon:yes gene_type:complete